jgi:hypothetical protein
VNKVTTYKEKVFSNQEVLLDGNTYNSCEFQNCVIVIGKGNFGVENSKFNACSLRFLPNSNAKNIYDLIKGFGG